MADRFQAQRSCGTLVVRARFAASSVWVTGYRGGQVPARQAPPETAGPLLVTVYFRIGPPSAFSAPKEKMARNASPFTEQSNAPLSTARAA